MEQNAIIFENQHGTIHFPLDITYNDSELKSINSGNFIYCHWHHEYEFILVEKGRATIEINNTPIEVCENEVLIINGDEIHTGYSTDNTHCCLYAIVFSPDMFNTLSFDGYQSSYIDPFIQKQYKFPTLIQKVPGWQARVLDQVNQIVSVYHQREAAFELKIIACLFNMLSEVISSRSFITQAESTDLKYKKLENFKIILSYIEANYNSKLYVSDLATVAGMSTDNFFKYFKRLTGDTPVTYINRYRVHEASKLLKNTQLQIMDIALNTGFENISYFIKIFKNLKGCTPSEYRKNG